MEKLTVAKVQNSLDVLENALNFYLEEGIGEYTPENSSERKRIIKAWARLQQAVLGTP
jgi:hypothetical protein